MICLPDGDKILVKVRPNSRKTEILSYNESVKLLEVAVAAPPEDSKANTELIKFLSRIKGKRARIKTGRSSKTKLIEFS